MRILHLAYEDPLQPGSGGGSIRAREINRRLAGRHEITALVAGYPGARPRTEDGVRWVPVGPRSGTKLDRLAYFPLLGPEVARRPHDLVVEEFGAPFSAGFSPLFTRRPVVASVQWLFASQMREKYHLPFDSVEQYGLRYYDRFISVSGWLAEELRARRPGAGVEVIPNGVEEIAFEAKTTAPRHLLFVGRLDIAHKGGDFLFDILARVRRSRGGRVPPLLILGEGPDRAAMEKLAKDRGLSDVVDFRGRVEGPEKYRLMADAYAVLMPSRHETFGMVAAESLAAGGPLVTFDVGPLREVVGGGAGVETGARLVPPYDVDAFAAEVTRLIEDPARGSRLREAGRDWARRYGWDEISVRQEECYLRAAEAGPPGGTRPARTRRKGRPAESSPGIGVPLDASLLSPLTTGGGRGRSTMLLVGNYGNGNVGDEAILARLLEVVGDACEVVVLSRNPERVERLHGAASVRTLSWGSIGTFLKARILAIGGGGIFGYGIRPLPKLLPGVALAARLLGKKTAYLAIGAYPGTPTPTRQLLRLSAAFSDVVSVRDAASLGTMTSRLSSGGARPILVRDPAVDLEPVPGEDAARVLRENEVAATPPPLGLSVKATPSPELNERTLSVLAEVVDWWCANRAGDVVLFAFSRHVDYGLDEGWSDAALARRLVGMVEAPQRLRVLGPDLHPRVLKGAVGLTAGMIGLRLHAQIFAWSTGRPLLGLSFEEKSDAFLGSVGAERVKLSDLGPRALVGWLERLPSSSGTGPAGETDGSDEEGATG